MLIRGSGGKPLQRALRCASLIRRDPWLRTGRTHALRACADTQAARELSTSTAKPALVELLEKVAAGAISPHEAATACQQLEYDAIGEYAKIDTARLTRTGFPEVIYAEGKTAKQVAEILMHMTDAGEPNVMATRVTAQAADEIRHCLPKSRTETYHFYPTGRILASKNVAQMEEALGRERGTACVAAAGTSDLPVAEEAVITLQLAGYHVVRLYDVGVAGIHRLLKNRHVLHDCDVAICVAGMDGALPGVVGGLTDVPVIAVPTSVGYGAAFGGLAPLLTMLNACSPGVGVVNIDNGFGAAVLAARILNRLASPRQTGGSS